MSNSYPEQAYPKDIEKKMEEDEDEILKSQGRNVQWNYTGGLYLPMPKLHLKKSLPFGYYQPNQSPNGQMYLSPIDVRLDGLVDFGKGVSQRIIGEIDLFWKSEEKFRHINKSIKVLYKRGLLMYGPPGCGKSSMISVVMRDIIAREGIALSYQGTYLTSEFIRIIREIQPKTKILVVMEDVDGWVNRNEEDVLNMLDGVDTVMDSVIFLATTNYYSNLSTRLLRPSRFDLKIEMDYPEPALRRRYLNDLMKSYPGKPPMNLDKAVRDTDGFSFADLKELFISACVFEYKYENCVKSLRDALHSEIEKNSRNTLTEKQFHAAKNMLTSLVGKR